MGKFLAIAVIVALIAFAIFGSNWLGKVNEKQGDNPRVEELRVCRYVSYNAPCEQANSRITQDNGNIFATVQPRNITNSMLKIKWEFVQGTTKSTIAEVSKEIFNDEVVQIELEKDLAVGWNIGDYQVTVTLDNTKPLTTQFNIVSE